MNLTMMPRPPHWITVVQGIGPTVVAIVIGAIAAGIAYQQWRTAKAKLLVDMYDRRYAFLTEALGYVKGYLVDRDVNTVLYLADLKMRSRYLFGPEVTKFLEQVIDDIEHANILEADSDIQARRSLYAMARLRDFHTRAYAAFGPYMSLASIADGR